MHFFSDSYDTHSSQHTDVPEQSSSVNAFLNVMTPLIEGKCIDIQTKRLYKRYIQRKRLDSQYALQVTEQLKATGVYLQANIQYCFST